MKISLYNLLHRQFSRRNNIFSNVLTVLNLQCLNGEPFRDYILEALDLITIVVPPALPAAMTVGRLHAQKRLKKKNIFCTLPRTINVAGSINCICFDKVSIFTNLLLKSESTNSREHQFLYGLFLSTSVTW